MTIEELKDFAIKTQAYTSSPEIVSFGFGITASVHMTESGFGAMFKKYQVAERCDAQFPYEKYVMVDGVKFFCLSKEK